MNRITSVLLNTACFVFLEAIRLRHILKLEGFELARINSITANVSNENAVDAAFEKNKPIVYFKEHPTTKHYQGIREERDWLFPQVNGYFPSFFGYWKKCERYL